MENEWSLAKLEQLIVHDQKLLCTVTAYASVLVIYASQISNPLPPIGIAATIVYFLIDATFLGQVFFEGESPFLRLAAGSFILVVALGLVAWAVMIAYNLSLVGSTATLGVVTTLCSLSNKMVKHKNVSK